MNITNGNDSRRRFLVRSCQMLALSSLPVGLIMAETDKVPEDDPLAVAMGYKEDANTVDLEKFPKRAGVEGQKQLCSNCSLYAGEGDWAPCAIFQNRLVAGPGWCNAWVPKAS